MSERPVALAVVVLLLVAGLLAWLRPLPQRHPPAPLPTSACAIWMADAVPGVGMKTRAEVAERIRTGTVPAAAREWFTPDR